MHRGVVHDDGPSGLDEGDRIAEVHMFDHDAPGKPGKNDYLFRFLNGRLGDEYNYLRGDVVQIAEAAVGGLVTIDRDATSVITPEDKRTIESHYKWWRDDLARKKKNSVKRTH